MTRIWIMFFSIVAYVAAHAQLKFTTVVPHRTLAPGESFQVQYILENANDVSDFRPPAFDGFRVVSGPNIYSGSQSSLHRNLVFTLVAVSEGRFKIHGTSCVVNGKLIKSNDAFVEVISGKDEGESPYFLRSGEDPLQKIKQNLFLKLAVDKRSCFVGEPLVATFKLYSRLQSRSNVVKNPGFYGFSVYDMVDVNDQMLSEERLDGHWFQVHTIRRVQLYPLQTGAFTVDAMELANEVEFSRSVVDKPTEQQVTEKMYGDDEGKKQASSTAEVYQVKLKTDPLVIKVNALPHRNIADTFAGAVGSFSITGFVEKDSTPLNEENYLTIAINGSGNFQRVNAPVVHWPNGLEGFEPSVTDTLNKQLVPLTGQRKFKYAFSSDQPGQYTIPAIAFSYFNLKSRSYKTISTKPVTVIVRSIAGRHHGVVRTQILSKTPRSQWALWLSASTLALIIGILFRLKSSLPRYRGSTQTSHVVVGSSISVEEFLKPVQSVLGYEDKIFSRELNMAIWNYLNYKFRISGSQMKKEMVKKILLSRNLSVEIVGNLVDLIQRSEACAYTNAAMDGHKKEIFQKTQDVLNAIDNGWS
ncbi:MAG TPA: BatD family protein [Chitinophagaceae bacterium]|nr:BatD family protein [Chitinophagaceae bacterium]